MALLTNRRTQRRKGAPLWAGTAFLVEALMLLAFLIAMLALFMALFTGAVQRERQAEQLTQAIMLAQNVAERFAADPSSVEEAYAQDGLVAQVESTAEEREEGTLWHATITVRADSPNANSADAEARQRVSDDIAYQLQTSRYVSRTGSVESGVTS